MSDAISRRNGGLREIQVSELNHFREDGRFGDFVNKMEAAVVLGRVSDVVRTESHIFRPKRMRRGIHLIPTSCILTAVLILQVKDHAVLCLIEKIQERISFNR